ncbi:MAG: hypothetical protein Q9183_003862 [Haloplaca sp. 2 TL-2023]
MNPQPSKAPEEDLVEPAQRAQRPTAIPPTQTLSHRMQSRTRSSRSDTISPHSKTHHPCMMGYDGPLRQLSTEQLRSAAQGLPIIQDMTRGGPVMAGATLWLPGWSGSTSLGRAALADQPRHSQEHNRYDGDQRGPASAGTGTTGSDDAQAATENVDQERDRGRMIVSAMGQHRPPSSLEPFPEYTEEGVELQDLGGEGAEPRRPNTSGARRCWPCRLINVIVERFCEKRKDCWFCRRKKARRQRTTTLEEATPVEEFTTQNVTPAEATNTAEFAISVEESSTTPQDATHVEETTTQDVTSGEESTSAQDATLTEEYTTTDDHRAAE